MDRETIIDKMRVLGWERSGDPADDGEALGDELVRGLRDALGLAERHMEAPAPDLVETVTQALMSDDVQEGWILLDENEAKVLAQAAVAALSSHLLKPGEVAVPRDA